jgi:uncharacterized protein
LNRRAPIGEPDELTAKAVRHVPTHIAAVPSRGRAVAGPVPAALWHDLDELLEAVYSSATKLGSAIHGPEHWHSVAVAALHLLKSGERADRPSAFLFALLHDARRINDGSDPEHGPRAAELLHELRERGLLLDMPERRAARLEHALRAHARGETSIDPTIALCWDADRLDIGRVGYALDPAFFSTATGRNLAAGAEPLRWAQGPPDWHELARRFGI